MSSLKKRKQILSLIVSNWYSWWHCN